MVIKDILSMNGYFWVCFESDKIRAKQCKAIAVEKKFIIFIFSVIKYILNILFLLREHYVKYYTLIYS
jgi:hypothetical protein